MIRTFLSFALSSRKFGLNHVLIALVRGEAAQLEGSRSLLNSGTAGIGYNKIGDSFQPLTHLTFCMTVSEEGRVARSKFPYTRDARRKFGSPKNSIIKPGKEGNYYLLKGERRQHFNMGKVTIVRLEGRGGARGAKYMTRKGMLHVSEPGLKYQVPAVLHLGGQVVEILRYHLDEVWLARRVLGVARVEAQHFLGRHEGAHVERQRPRVDQPRDALGA